MATASRLTLQQVLHAIDNSDDSDDEVDQTYESDIEVSQVNTDLWLVHFVAWILAIIKEMNSSFHRVFVRFVLKRYITLRVRWSNSVFTVSFSQTTRILISVTKCSRYPTTI